MIRWVSNRYSSCITYFSLLPGYLGARNDRKTRDSSIVIHSANQSRSVYQNAAGTTSLSRRMIDFGPGSFKLALVALFSSRHADLAAWRQRARVHVRVCDAAPDGCND